MRGFFCGFCLCPPGCRSHITPHLHIPGQFFVSVLYRGMGGGSERRGNPFLLGQCVILARRKGMRIPTTSLRTGLGMTVVGEGGLRRFILRIMPKSARRLKQPPSLRGAKRRGNPFLLGQCVVLAQRKVMRIPTTSERTGLGMTVVGEGGLRRFILRIMPKSARRLTPTCHCEERSDAAIRFSLGDVWSWYDIKETG